MSTFDQSAYEIWKREVAKLAPIYVVCPDCNGDGKGVCPHCGNDTDCETCSGDGNVRPEEILTPEFYMRVVMFERTKLEHWVNRDALATRDAKGRVIENHNPLSEFTKEFQPHPLSNVSRVPKIALRLPITTA